MSTHTIPAHKRMVFIGNYGNRNIGDDAILQVLSMRYAASYPQWLQHVFVRHFASDVTRISSALPLSMTVGTILWVMLRMNIIVIGGGGLFGAHMGPAARFIPLFALVCRMLGKTIIYESVGFYAATPLIQRGLLLLSMFTAERVSVRDETSWRMTEALRRWRPVERVDDPGFTIVPSSPEHTLDLLKREGIALPHDSTRLIGLSLKRILRDEAHTQRILVALVYMCQWLLDEGYELLFVPFCHDPQKWSEQDVAFAEDITCQLSQPERVMCIRGYYTPQEVAGVMNHTHMFVGMRYHAQVFAHALNIPLLPIAYEEKRTDLIREYDYPLIPVDNLTGEILVEALKKTINTRRPSGIPSARVEDTTVRNKVNIRASASS